MSTRISDMGWHKHPILRGLGFQGAAGYRVLDRVDDLLKARPRLFYGGPGFQRMLPGGVNEDQAVNLIAQTDWAQNAAAGVVNQLGLSPAETAEAKQNWARHLARGLVNSIPSAPPPPAPRGPGRPPAPGSAASRRRERAARRAEAEATPPAPAPTPIEAARAAAATSQGTPPGTTFAPQLFGRFGLLRRRR